MRLTRRAALQLGGAVFLGAAMGCPRRGPTAVGPFGAERADLWMGEIEREVSHPLDVAPAAVFPLGVASGDVDDEGAVLWTRSDRAAPLLLAVFEDADGLPGATLASVLVAGTEAGDDGRFVHVAIGGVTPGARYHYGFFLLGEDGEVASRSPLGRFSAGRALDDDTALLLGASACTRAGEDLALLDRAADAGADVWVLLGDTVYADGSRNLDEYRGAWHAGLSAAPYRRLRERLPLLATWDDHEVSNNFDPETFAPELLQAARGAFFEHLPLAREPDDEQRIWRQRRFGRTLEVFVLDTRGERRPSTRESDAPLYVSRAQMEWLKDALVRSEAAFKIIVNSVPISEMPFPFEEADRWQGYRAQRAEILSFIDDADVSGVLWLSGDIHMGSVGRISREGAGSQTLEVMVGSTANFTNPLAGLFAAPQFDFATAENNTVELELHPRTGEVVVRFFGRSGRLFERRYPIGRAAQPSRPLM